MRLSKFSQSFLITLAFIAILPYLLITGLLLEGEDILYPELLYHAFYVILLGILAFAAILLWIEPKISFYLVKRQLSGNKVDLSLIVSDCESLLEDFGLSTKPEVFLVNEKRPPFSYGVNRGRSIIIFPTGLLALGDAERKSIIAHELWHIKTDGEALYFDDKRNVTALILCLIVVGSIWAIIFEHDYLGWWTAKLCLSTLYPCSSAISLYPPTLLLLVILALAYPLIFVLLSPAILIVMGYPRFIRRDYREYLADSVSGIITQKPLSMARALSNSIALIGFPNRKEISEIGLFSATKKPKRIARNWRDSFNARFMWRSFADPSYRISHLYLLEKMMVAQVALRWKKDPLGTFARLSLNLSFHMSRVLFGTVFSGVNKRLRWKTIQYMSKNSQSFNIVACSSTSGASNLDTYLVFFQLVIEGWIEVTEPPFEPEKIMTEIMRLPSLSNLEVNPTKL